MRVLRLLGSEVIHFESKKTTQGAMSSYSVHPRVNLQPNQEQLSDEKYEIGCIQLDLSLQGMVLGFRQLTSDNPEDTIPSSRQFAYLRDIHSRLRHLDTTETWS